jgi:hypothetical protein
MSEATSGIAISTSGPGFRFAHPGYAALPPFSDLHVKTKLLSRINPVIPVKAHLQKYSDFPKTQIRFISTAVPAQQRGAFRDRHERRARDAVDAGGARTEALLADGEVVWS